MIKCFYAYASKIEGVVFSIQYAIREINAHKESYGVEIIDWKEDLDISGNIIIDKVCEAIDECEVFLCDLTEINLNVLFELGYALINGKRIWISIDSSFYDAPKFYEDLKILTTLGYREHISGPQLLSELLNDNPWNFIEKNPYKKIIKSHTWSYVRKPRLFYLKSSINTNESRYLTREIEKNFQDVVTDDPLEYVTTSPLEWYMEQVFTSYAVAAHFLDNGRNEKHPQNAKYAFICGMAYGLRRKPIMFAHNPYVPEIDYRDIMIVPNTISQFQTIVDKWVKETSKQITNYRKKYQSRPFGTSENLGFIDIGEFKAEDEKNKLSDYFIRTIFYNNAIATENYHVFIGRKGSGKTANFYQISDILENEYKQDNYVCKIKPVDVELEGVFRLFELSTHNDFKEHIIDNLWKFLIYSELAQNLYRDIKQKISENLISEEKSLLLFMDSNKFLLEDFSVRLETLLTDICNVDFNAPNTNQREKISQILHQEIFVNFRRLIGSLLSSKDKVFILLDNLDKTWEPKNEISLIARFLFRLFNTSSQIVNDLSRSDSRIEPVNLALIIFLRSDIFTHIIPYVSEPDKLNYTIMTWNDSELLIRVVEKRFVSATENTEYPEEVWKEFFCPTVDSISTREYIINAVMPKPRDVIFLCKYALMYAKNRGADIIEEIDIKKAEENYSKHVWDTLIVELKADFEEIKSLLTKFAGKNEIIAFTEIDDIISNFSKKLLDTESVIELLITANFLGIETKENEFTFMYDLDKDREEILKTLSENTSKIVGSRRFEINRPFHHYLKIQKN